MAIGIIYILKRIENNLKLSIVYKKILIIGKNVETIGGKTGK